MPSRPPDDPPDHKQDGLAPPDDVGLARIDLEALSATHREVARFAFANPGFTGQATAAELAERLGVAESTVVRFAKAIGFHSYKAFRQSMRHHHLGKLTALEIRERVPSHESVHAAWQNQVMQDVQNLHASLESVDASHLEWVAEAIGRARSVVVVAVGSYASVAHVLVHMLRFLGIRAVVEDRDAANVAAALVPLDERDLLIGISFWQINQTTANALRWARQRGIPCAAITDSAYSPLAELADRSLVVATESGSFFQSLVAPLSLVYAIGAHQSLAGGEARQRSLALGGEIFEFFRSMLASGDRKPGGKP